MNDNKEGISFAFVCKNEGYSSILELFDFSALGYEQQFFGMHSQCHDFEDITSMEKVWYRDVITADVSRSAEFIESLCWMYESKRIKIIEVNIVKSYMKMLKIKDKILLENLLEKCTKNVQIANKETVDAESMKEVINEIIEMYLEDIFLSAGRKYPKTDYFRTGDHLSAMMIIYSICCDRHLGHFDGLSMKDLQNITFTSEEDVHSLLETAIGQNIIRKIPMGSEKRSIIRYVITHDYMAKHLDTYCVKSLPPQIISNIQFYCQNVSNGKNLKKAVLVPPLSCYCEAFIEKSDDKTSQFVGATGINIFATILSMLLFAFTYFWMSCNPKFFNISYNQFAYVSASEYSLAMLAVCGSLFYIYNYLHKFSRIFLDSRRMDLSFWLCVSLIPLGAGAVTAVFVYKNWWASWLAMEFVLLGIFQYSISLKSQGNIKGLLRKEGSVFIAIGCILISMNFVVYYIMNQAMHSWYLMYIAFITLTVRQHINTDYMLAKLGGFSLSPTHVLK